MDTLRTSLRVLFQRIDGQQVLYDLLERGVTARYADQQIDEQLFVRLFRELDNGYSLEQLDAVVQLLDSEWMNGPKISRPILASRKSLFRVLGFFAESALHLHNNEPVCRYMELLRWNELSAQLGEDMLTTAFLADHDLRMNHERTSFTWPAIINHDNQRIHHRIDHQPLAELHFHLNGSTQLFELNWLSLMNHITGRGEQFQQMSHYQEPSYTIHDTENGSSLYLATIKACAIRYLLNMRLRHTTDDTAFCEDKQLVLQILRCKRVTAAYPLLNQLEERIQSYGCSYAMQFGGELVDYAITGTPSLRDLNNEYHFKHLIIAGERRWMYHTFRQIFSGAYNNPIYPTLFYAYLLFKVQVRHELVQLNDKVGFDNFSHYERRKALFIPEGSIYDALVANLAVSPFLLRDKQHRYLEARIAPARTALAMEQKIHRLNRDIADRRFSPVHPPSDGRIKPDATPRRNDLHYNYIVHFIKEKDSLLTDKNNALLNIVPRHHFSRKKYTQQAMAIAKLWQSYAKAAEDITGIDAANAERRCRPEVFGQVFRYLRAVHPDSRLNHFVDRQRHALRVTYHVGEDFLDIVDGLRAVDEARIFLNLQRHDRLGHALVLGVDVEHHYKRNHRRIVMPKPMFLDNIVWLYFKAANYQLEGVGLLRAQIEVWFQRLIREIYPHRVPHTSLYEYYLSWLLRGDDPERYRTIGHDHDKRSISAIDATPWGQAALCHTPNYEALLEEARNCPNARWLYHTYHFDPHTKQMELASDEFLVDESFIRLVAQTQQKMLEEMAEIGLCIETNPTSNLRIQQLPCYRNHPIHRFYNYGLHLSVPRFAMPVTINTDDLGVFATSLEREYALLACGLEKGLAHHPECETVPLDIYNWLDEIRAMGFEQAFQEDPLARHAPSEDQN